MKIEVGAITPHRYHINDTSKPLGEGIFSIAVGEFGKDTYNGGYTIGIPELFPEILVFKDQVLLLKNLDKDTKLVSLFIKKWEPSKSSNTYQIHSIINLSQAHSISVLPIRSAHKFTEYELFSSSNHPVLGSRNPIPIVFSQLNLTTPDYLTPYISNTVYTDGKTYGQNWLNYLRESNAPVNTAIGYVALNSSTGSRNTAVGYNALYTQYHG